MLEEFWAHHFFENPKAEEVVEDEDFNLDEELAKLEELPDDFEDVN